MDMLYLSLALAVDDRLAGYLTVSGGRVLFEAPGFRWDFLFLWWILRYLQAITLLIKKKIKIALFFITHLFNWNGFWIFGHYGYYLTALLIVSWFYDWLLIYTTIT